MEKVKLVKEVAEVFEKAKLNYEERDIIRRAASGGFPLEYKRLNGVLPETIVKAYYFGYEVETPEEIVKEMFDNYKNLGEIGRHVVIAIRKTLNAYNIKINGIN
ncbi:hypothetical protein [Cytobacillus praedii]|uniref:Uncharacterized protein n=1 Tax=Cytobacillus praedii TaxID=1742358 RepID=A0A4R1ALJ6_9BACI|nr:hypothetical protein [Cytobacillus praedii]TCJ00438.1 hypothetical protein E0Y62_26870 [Cytobacillus praedii]